MEQLLSMPAELAKQLLSLVLDGPPDKGLSMQDQNLNEWTFGKAADEVYGEIFQIHFRPILVKAYDTD